MCGKLEKEKKTVRMIKHAYNSTRKKNVSMIKQLMSLEMLLWHFWERGMIETHWIK
ncbi:Hypothetical protein FKW44_021093 [Caligus rogercresseyi]|uniref:Uncharacterized protein n=1 Tax=Caligus rogercresseyi TaxID=217165 RepID=A0A7T8GQQ5_CALRO|nr:Hypothetical protein FKW44_021093 [Caligus rogercresseyi]